MKTHLLPCQACGGMLQVPDNSMFVNCEFCGQLNGVEKTHGQLSLKIEQQFDAVALGVRIPYWEKKLAQWEKSYADVYAQHSGAVEGLKRSKMEMSSANARFVWLGVFFGGGTIAALKVLDFLGGTLFGPDGGWAIAALVAAALLLVLSAINARAGAQKRLAEAEETVTKLNSACERAWVEVHDLKDKIAHAEHELDKLDD